jgi:hypothetical protein
MSASIYLFMKNNPILLQLHRLLHSPSYSAKVKGALYKVQIANNGCRYVDVHTKELGQLRLMVQNKTKASAYAARARAGETLTWIIPKDKTKSWELIDVPALLVPSDFDNDDNFKEGESC